MKVHTRNEGMNFQLSGFKTKLQSAMMGVFIAGGFYESQWTKLLKSILKYGMIQMKDSGWSNMAGDDGTIFLGSEVFPPDRYNFIDSVLRYFSNESRQTQQNTVWTDQRDRAMLRRISDEFQTHLNRYESKSLIINH